MDDYKFRWYSDQLGRFVSPDDILPDLNNPQSLNRYSYVNNDPVNATDPTGHRIVCDDGYLGSCGDSAYSNGSYTPPHAQGGGGSGGGNGGNNPNHDGTTVSVNPPQTLTYRPLDSNVVYQQYIYDYSYYHRKPIGYESGYYEGENSQTDWGSFGKDLLPIPDLSHPVSLKNADIAYSLYELAQEGTEMALKTLEPLGLHAAEAESSPIGAIMFGMEATKAYNDNTIVTGQFRIEISYYPTLINSTMVDPISSYFYTKR